MAQPNQPIIIKKVKKGGHAHHGGAWKIAYADFVTAMMAFFLLLWLISMATPEQKEGLADYFSPPNISPTQSGAGGVMGGLAFEERGARMDGSAPDASQRVSTSADIGEFGDTDAAPAGELEDASERFEAGRTAPIDSSAPVDDLFQSAAASIRQAWQAMPEIAEISDNLIVEETDEGLNIVITDQEGRPMFAPGSRNPLEHTRRAIAAIAPILERLPSQIRIAGHVAAGSAHSTPSYGPWELSSDRAQTTRLILGEFGLSGDRVHSVMGRASADPIFPAEPYLALNERVEITVLRAAPPVPPGLHP